MDNTYHKSNPFLESIGDYMGEIQKRSRKQVYLMDSISGQLMTEPDSSDLAKLTYTTGVVGFSDKQPYVKIFTSGLKSLMNLSGPALKVFVWIAQNMKPKQDLVILIPIKVRDELGYAATKPVHDGIKDLIANNIIARAFTGNRNSPAYWINPTIFYNGNRRHLYKKNK